MTGRWENISVRLMLDEKIKNILRNNMLDGLLLIEEIQLDGQFSAVENK